MKESAKVRKDRGVVRERPMFHWKLPWTILRGCHGEDEREVFDELCQIVEETLDLYYQDKKPLPPSTFDKYFANKMLSNA